MTKHRHFIIHKPYGYLSQFVHNERRRRNRKLLGELHDFPEGTMSIGRLDQDSEGLLLLTTDGKVSHQVLSKKVEKEYYIQVDGIITDKAIEELKKGVDIALQGETYETLPCKAFRLDSEPGFPPRTQKIRDARHGPTSWMAVTVNEGKFRQVRKMSAAVGFPTLRLVRVRIGNIHLNDMKSGDVVEVEGFGLSEDL
ncbi:pseudouridine synthase [Fulvivirga lutimaris]|uniref:pseudouridine synthase n=1 Tax=Fulvivirga lutimaris TaxID=1819566 RepID=UPI0012BC9AFC|nr:pseudouridine synthase [Fulvivirga lutimaris]MTI38663.1 pseudouridine synthase [Fulvivirga lutimaris]